jgi:hypothetical protein
MVFWEVVIKEKEIESNIKMVWNDWVRKDLCNIVKEQIGWL